MNQQWYVRTSKGKAGPFSAPKLKKLAAEGKISTKTKLSLDGSKWIPASSVDGLDFSNDRTDEPRKEMGDSISGTVRKAKASPDGSEKHESEKAGNRIVLALIGAAYGFGLFVFIWLFWVINIWPLTLGLTAFSNTEPSKTSLGKLASSISSYALSEVAFYVMGVCVVVGGIVLGIAGNHESESEQNDSTPTDPPEPKELEATPIKTSAGEKICQICGSSVSNYELYDCPKCRIIFCCECLNDKRWSFWSGSRGNCPSCSEHCNSQNVIGFQSDSGSDD